MIIFPYLSACLFVCLSFLLARDKNNSAHKQTSKCNEYFEHAPICLRSFHSIHNVVDRGVLQAMWGNYQEKLDTVINSLSAKHAYLNTLYWRITNKETVIKWIAAIIIIQTFVRRTTAHCQHQLNLRRRAPPAVARWRGWLVVVV